MTGAMYAGIAGLRTHMEDLNVIGNNIANINTKGYKAGRSVFRSALYTQISGGREGTSVLGSKNPSQLGYGVSLGSVDIDMSTGNYSPGKPTDMMIDGDGFFLVGDKELADVVDPRDPSTLKSFNLTRVGDVEFKEDGYLSDSLGSVVYGFLCIGTVDGKPVYSDQLVPIRAPYMDENGDIMWPHYENVTEDGGDAANAEDGKWTLVDSEYPWGDEADAGADDAVQYPYQRAKLTNITIGKDGVIEATVKETNQKITIGAIALGTVDNPNGVTQMTNTYYTCGQGAGELAVNMIGGRGKDVLVCSTNLPRGEELDDLDGTFREPKQGETAEYGDAVIRKGMTYVNESQVTNGDDAGTDEDLNLPYGSRVFDSGSSATLVVGGLEMSKTDLATEIANMITTQRGYQANTRVITVTDSMLEELVNMKR